MVNHDKYWNGQKIWDGVIRKPVVKNYKISLCTTCMNRLEDLNQTMPFNIAHEIYPDVEFLLLDYNSKNALDEWAKPYVEKGVLTYYRTEDPQYYSMAHSRNVAFTLATGDVVVNVDADNFIQPRDKETMSPTFCEILNIFANDCEGVKGVFAKGKRLLHGRLGCFRKEFIEMGGYDEEMLGYGYDDIDLLRRLWALGCNLYWFGGIYLDRIKTARSMKGANMQNKNWRETERINKALGWKKFEEGDFIRNRSGGWAKCRVVKNFKEEISVGNP
jgi:glycosyltransferase involved in cell wall biosynthesis